MNHSKLMMLQHCMDDRYAHVIVAANSTQDVAPRNKVEEIEENIKQGHTLLSDPPKPVVLGIPHLTVILNKQHKTV